MTEPSQPPLAREASLDPTGVCSLLGLGVPDFPKFSSINKPVLGSKGTHRLTVGQSRAHGKEGEHQARRKEGQRML